MQAMSGANWVTRAVWAVSLPNGVSDDAGPLTCQERRIVMQRMQVKRFSTCPQHGQVVLEDPDGMVQLNIRMRPMMAHWLAHELKECQCPVVSMYRLLQELLAKFGGNLRVSLIDASADNTPLGMLIISCPNGAEIYQACHPADAIALAARTH